MLRIRYRNRNRSWPIPCPGGHHRLGTRQATTHVNPFRSLGGPGTVWSMWSLRVRRHVRISHGRRYPLSLLMGSPKDFILSISISGRSPGERSSVDVLIGERPGEVPDGGIHHSYEILSSLDPGLFVIGDAPIRW